MGENMPSVYVKTLGCKVNTFDGHVLENQFQEKGYQLAQSPVGADVTVVNTCSVTANADREARYLARRLRRESPNTVLVFTGCYAQTDSSRLTAMDEVDFVVPNEAKERLVAVVQEGIKIRQSGGSTPKLPSGIRPVKDNRQAHFKSSLAFFDKADSAQTRAFVKVQDGCNGFCTYCLIPYARGASRSVPLGDIVAECERLVSLGTKEIVLTGIHIGDWGRDLPAESDHPWPIATLVEKLFALPSLGRLRISSLEPAELSPELVAVLARNAPRVSDHLHLPLQSGHDRILRLMRRQYDSAGYAAAVRRFRTEFPAGAIGADVIPGFPSESEAEFEQTVEFICSQELSYLHVFPYSARPNTAAERMPGHLPREVIKERSDRLRALSRELAHAYARKFVGGTTTVLWEKDVDARGRRLGRSANYLQVAAAYDAKAGDLDQVVLKGFIDGDRLLGKRLDLV